MTDMANNFKYCGKLSLKLWIFRMMILYILNVNEKLPASKFQYFGKYKKQLFSYCYVHVSGQRQTGLER